MIADVMERDGTVRGYPKGKKPVRFPVTPRTATAFSALRKMFPGGDMDLVFRVPKKSGSVRLLPQYITGLWHQARTKAGLNEPAVKFHDLRHACATNLARAGHTAMVIKAVLRHAGLSTSQIYIDAVSDDEFAGRHEGCQRDRGFPAQAPRCQTRTGRARTGGQLAERGASASWPPTLLNSPWGTRDYATTGHH